jgi:cystathionine beta-lyase/cystathionine gamma-synthase
MCGTKQLVLLLHVPCVCSQLAVASKIASLEGGAHAAVMASGMASISVTLMALLSSGDHMLIQRDLYGRLQCIHTSGTQLSFVSLHIQFRCALKTCNLLQPVFSRNAC